MQDVGPAMESDFVLSFLRAEVDTQEYGPTIKAILSQFGQNRKLIDGPDLKDAYANRVRKDVLRDYRGYGINKWLFERFPEDIAWRRLLLGSADMGRLKYVNTPHFCSFSPTRMVSEGAQNYKNNSRAAEKVDGILKDLSVVSDELAVVEGQNGELVIIEGNHRATAFCVAKKAEATAIVAKSPTMHLWRYF